MVNFKKEELERIRLLPPKSVFLDLSQQKQEAQWDGCVLSPVNLVYSPVLVNFDPVMFICSAVFVLWIIGLHRWHTPII